MDYENNTISAKTKKINLIGWQHEILKSEFHNAFRFVQINMFSF